MTGHCHHLFTDVISPHAVRVCFAGARQFTAHALWEREGSLSEDVWESSPHLTSQLPSAQSRWSSHFATSFVVDRRCSCCFLRESRCWSSGLLPLTMICRFALHTWTIYHSLLVTGRLIVSRLS